MRRPAVVAGVVAGAVLALLAAPGTASADVLFDQADADELVATLAEAYEAQQVCYGWEVTVDNVGMVETSVGSNFGAGEGLQESAQANSCTTTVEFLANITWTSESSESEDSASYQVSSLPAGPTTADLDSLELISDDGLAGENPDVDVYKAVSALPLLAADAGVADALEASPAPETEAEAAGGRPTDSPGSDFWRRAGGAILWSALLIVAGGVFAFWALRSSPGAARRRAAAAPTEPAPEYVPAEWYDQKTAGQGNVRPTPPPYEPEPPAPGPTGRRSSGPPAPPTGPSRPDPGKAEPGQADPNRADANRAEPTQAGPDEPGPDQAGPRAAESRPPVEAEPPGGAKAVDQAEVAEGGERNEDQTPPGGSAGKPAGKPDTETRPEG